MGVIKRGRCNKCSRQGVRNIAPTEEPFCKDCMSVWDEQNPLKIQAMYLLGLIQKYEDGFSFRQYLPCRLSPKIHTRIESGDIYSAKVLYDGSILFVKKNYSTNMFWNHSWDILINRKYLGRFYFEKSAMKFVLGILQKDGCEDLSYEFQHILPRS